jgi:hypothetical protein
VNTDAQFIILGGRLLDTIENQQAYTKWMA